MVEILCLKVEKTDEKVIIHIEMEKGKFTSTIMPLLVGMAKLARSGSLSAIKEIKEEEECVET